jgi:hypothetical protein
MAYTRRPLNPLTPYVNQVVVESNKVNDNFDILAQAFVDDNPETFKVKNALNSDNAVNSDTVDGFHASLTPAPNVIVPLNEDGILDLNATYIKSNVYTFRRVDLTGATSDYMLQVGEEAYISFSNATNVPLRIATENNRIYEIILQFTVNLSNTGAYTFLNPNNTTYSSSFSHCSVYWNSGGGSGWVSYTTSDSAFKIYSQTPHTYMILETFRRTVKGIISYEAGDTNIGYGIFTSKWKDTTTAWTSLGTFVFPQEMSGIILIRRLV